MRDALVTSCSSYCFRRTKLLGNEDNPYINESNLAIIENNRLNFKLINEIFTKVTNCTSAAYISDGLSCIYGMIILNIIYMIFAFFFYPKLIFTLMVAAGSIGASIIYFLAHIWLYYYYSVYTTRKFLKSLCSSSDYSFDITVCLNLQLLICPSHEETAGENEGILNINSSFRLVNIFQPAIKSFSNQGDAYEENKEIDSFVKKHYPEAAYEITEDYYNSRNSRQCCVNSSIIFSYLVTIVAAAFVWNNKISVKLANSENWIGVYLLIVVLFLMLLYVLINLCFGKCIKSEILSEKGKKWKQKGFHIEKLDLDTLIILEYNTDISSFKDKAIRFSINS